MPWSSIGLKSGNFANGGFHLNISDSHFEAVDTDKLCMCTTLTENLTGIICPVNFSIQSLSVHLKHLGDQTFKTDGRRQNNIGRNIEQS